MWRFNPPIPFVPARNYTYGPAVPRKIRLFVIHVMQNQEKPGTAIQVAKWIGGLIGPAPEVSFHLGADAAQVVECVRPGDIAWAAPGANGDGYHIELAGRSGQSTDDWHDPYSQAMLQLVARTIAPLAVHLGIPAIKLDPPQVADKVSIGFCGHWDVTQAFHKSTHTDPGPNFPWAEFLTMVASEIEGLK